MEWAFTGKGWFRYGTALIAVAITVLLHRFMTPAIPPTPFLFSFIPVVLAAWLGGRGPALVAGLVAALADTYFFVVPFESFVWKREALVGVGAFLVTSGLVAEVCASLMERATRPPEWLHATIEDLQIRVAALRVQVDDETRARQLTDLEDELRQLQALTTEERPT